MATKFKKPVEVLLQSGHPKPHLFKLVKPIEKKLNVKFIADDWDYQKCYFLVEGCRGEKSVKAKEAKIVQSLMDVGIGYRKGVFVDRKWFSCYLEAKGVSRQEIENLLEVDGSRGMKNIEDRRELGEELHLYHKKNKFDPIRISFPESSNLLAVISCEDTEKLRLLVAYFTGALVKHCWDSLESIQTAYYEEEAQID